MTEYLDLIRRRREEIISRADAALTRAGRSWSDVKVMAVSKTVGVEQVLDAIRAGYRFFGENRPQELVRKLEGLEAAGVSEDVRFDMIGNLQTNKINAVLGRAACIHSISSLHLAEAVSSRAERRMGEGLLAAPQPVLLEVNVSGEASKSGFAPDDLRASMDALRELRGIHIEGLMTMAPRGDKGRARETFAGLRTLRDELEATYADMSLPELSCGMSEDFEIALEEGSTLVRLGRVVFDPAFELE
ncbi:YggS family pyridoxal phosphate-dependent enzyme [Collinsella sp. An2]|uniref:YggS family pyridoxal phosphate-dependent enzyme n=1 Tax=Collinsella sp. An2 TaxID=1965585 RepID=UPI000B3916AA|nr:YggS family pyridoxal phosphate-dependent enzyme [Collinsella sp. An2]OUP08664.1 YggS family pyridoxal phosphate enzyme [Collinsella sp. An2]